MTEFNDAAHYGFFLTGPTLNNQTGKYLRQSELTLAALRAAGVLSNMVDSVIPPATDKLWLDKNFDPAVLKGWDSTGLAWMPVTFDRLFNRGVNKLRVVPLTQISSSANFITVVEPSEFFDGLLFSLTPVANNTGNVFITVQGVGTYPVMYANGNYVSENELVAGEPKILMFLDSEFVVLLPTAPSFNAARDAIAARDIAAGYASDAVSQGNVPIYATAVGMAALEVPAGINAVRVNGHGAAGDGGAALYRKVSGEPSHAGSFQSADGAWWELADLRLTPQMLGAVPDWDGASGTDNTAAINNLIAIGRPIEWGSGRYMVADTISQTIAGDLKWCSDGAELVFNPHTPRQKMLDLSVLGGTYSIEGSFFLDANSMAFVGLFAENDTDNTAVFLTEDLRVENVYRASTAFSGGDGIWLRGNWESVAFTRPIIRNMKMAPGAGIAGSQGIFGISVTPAGNRGPKRVTITDPTIDKVACEDTSYTHDQDGIRVFAPEDIPGDNRPHECSFTLIGGTIKNCHGRSVKSQMQFGSVSKTKFIRTEGNDTHVGNEEIEFQVGGGSVNDIEVLYDGYVPSAIVSFLGVENPGNRVHLGSLKGLRGSISGSYKPFRIIKHAAYESTRQMITAEDIQLFGGVTHVAGVGGASGGRTILNLRDVVADAEVSFVRCVSGGTFNVNASNCYQLGAGIPLVDPTGQIAIVNADGGCIGFTAADSINGTQMGSFTRVEALAPQGVVAGGVLRPVVFSLANGASAAFPPSFFNANTGILIVSVGQAADQQGIFACDSNKVAQLAVTSATGFAVGTTSEPASGNFRLWATGTGPMISNRSGADRTITCWMLG